MISYVTIGVSDMEKAKAFYLALFEDIGGKLLVDRGRIAMIGDSLRKPFLGICTPFDEKDPHSGNGNMVAIALESKQKVDEMYEKALSLGAVCDGKPGQRVPDFFYGAYFKDVDGNKLTFCYFG